MALDPLSYGPTYALVPGGPLEVAFFKAARDPNSGLQALLDAAEAFPQEVLNNPAFPLHLVVDPGAVTNPTVNQIAGAAALAKHKDAPDHYLEMALRSSDPRVFCSALINPRLTPERMEWALCNSACELMDVDTPTWDTKPVRAEVIRRLPLERARTLAGTDLYMLAALMSRRDQSFAEAIRYYEGLRLSVPDGDRPPHHALLSHPGAPEAFFESVLEKPHWLDLTDLARYAPTRLLEEVVRHLQAKWSEAFSPLMEMRRDYEAREPFRHWRRTAYWLIQRQAELTPEAIDALTQLHLYDALLYFTQSPCTPNFVLQGILENGRQAGGGDNNHHGALFAMAAAHPNFVLPSPVHNFSDAEALADELAANSIDAPYVLAGIACHPKAPLRIVRELLERDDVDAHYAIGQIARGALHPEVRAVALEFKGHPCEAFALGSLHATPYQLDHGANSPAADSRLAVASNSNTLTITLLRLKSDQNPEVAEKANWTLFDHRLYGRPLRIDPASTIPSNHPEIAF